MKHDKLLAKIKNEEQKPYDVDPIAWSALSAVVKLHSPFDGYCQRCTVNNWGETRQEYPCDEIQIIEKELR